MPRQPVTNHRLALLPRMAKPVPWKSLREAEVEECLARERQVIALEGR